MQCVWCFSIMCPMLENDRGEHVDITFSSYLLISCHYSIFFFFLRGTQLLLFCVMVSYRELRPARENEAQNSRPWKAKLPHHGGPWGVFHLVMSLFKGSPQYLEGERAFNKPHYFKMMTITNSPTLFLVLGNTGSEGLTATLSVHALVKKGHECAERIFNAALPCWYFCRHSGKTRYKSNTNFFPTL